MTKTIEELSSELEILKEKFQQQSALLRNIVAVMHIADTDLRNHLDMLE